MYTPNYSVLPASKKRQRCLFIHTEETRQLIISKHYTMLHITYVLGRKKSLVCNKSLDNCFYDLGNLRGHWMGLPHMNYIFFKIDKNPTKTWLSSIVKLNIFVWAADFFPHILMWWLVIILQNIKIVTFLRSTRYWQKSTSGLDSIDQKKEIIYTTRIDVVMCSLQCNLYLLMNSRMS